MLADRSTWELDLCTAAFKADKGDGRPRKIYHSYIEKDLSAYTLQVFIVTFTAITCTVVIAMK